MEKSGEGISRRGLLKVGLGGTAFLAELFHSKKARAQLEKILETQELVRESFEKRLEWLRNEVFERNYERFFIFIKKGAREGWFNIEKHASLDMTISIDLLPIFADSQIEEGRFVHTHPLTIVEADRLLPIDTISEIRSRRQSNFPLVPSAQDIETLLRQKVHLASLKSPQKIIHYVLDPAGVWSYDLDFAHPKVQKIVKDLEQEPREQEDPRLDIDLLTVSHTEAEFITLSYQLEERQRLFYKNGVGITGALLKEFQDWACEKWGIILTFTSYPREHGRKISAIDKSGGAG